MEKFDFSEVNNSIIYRFESIAKRNPAKKAIVDSNSNFTYLELSRKVDELSEALQFKCENYSNKKIKSVHLLFGHGTDMIIAMLSVLKLGYCYVPLATQDPIERLDFILEDSEASIILTDDMNLTEAHALQNYCKRELIILNINKIERTKQFNCILNLDIDPSQLAYILYTSGSTGKPKGVIQNHRNVLHFIRNYTNNLQISVDDNLTGFSFYCFDASVMSIFGALLNGSTLYLYDLNKYGLIDLKDWINNNKITIYHSTPTVFRYFMSVLNAKDTLKNVRLVVLGGEAVVKRDVELYKDHFSDHAIMINGLGPTESTVTLQFVITKKTEINGATIPVGFPVEDTEVFVVMLNGIVAPDGEIGELIFCSDYLAIGYLNLPEESKKRFLNTNPFSAKRAYRTGDFGRRLESGCFEFMGRSDYQIKIRGHRVELIEIEQTINRIKGVDECIVIPFLIGDEYTIIGCYTSLENNLLDVSYLNRMSQV